MKGNGIGRLRRVLKSIAWLYPEIGYCQGMGVVSKLYEIGIDF